MTPEEISRFIDSNCHNCKRQKPLMTKARCDLWNGLKNGSMVTKSIAHTFINEDGICKYINAKEHHGQDQ